jgi:hypothetical protein
VLQGSKQEQMEAVRGHIRAFKAQHELDKIIVLWTANTERFAAIEEGACLLMACSLVFKRRCCRCCYCSCCCSRLFVGCDEGIKTPPAPSSTMLTTTRPLPPSTPSPPKNKSTGNNDTAENLLAAIARGEEEISPSTLFAVASIMEGCSYINGSPQNTFVPGVVELAERHKVSSAIPSVKREDKAERKGEGVEVECNGMGVKGGGGVGGNRRGNGRSSPSISFGRSGPEEAGQATIHGRTSTTIQPNTTPNPIMHFTSLHQVYIGGDDFKSGQTKMKSVLVDFLVSAGIKPTSIVSYNHLGNNDGKNLSAPQTFRSKVRFP